MWLLRTRRTRQAGSPDAVTSAFRQSLVMDRSIEYPRNRELLRVSVEMTETSLVALIRISHSEMESLVELEHSGPQTDLISTGDVPNLMNQIRPQWQAKGLIERVRKLLPVDPSSACQRLLNAAIRDLREKIIIAGVDIAKEAAATHRLPPVTRADDIDNNYSTTHILDLSYRMGLLSRAEWRRMTRAYDIRRDLEHEDSEYEAGLEDCIYIFKTCIEAVLSRDPVNLVKVQDVKQIVEAAGPAVPDAEFVEDYRHAPDTRQEEILKFLVSKALSDSEPDLVRQNAFTLLQALRESTHDSVRVVLAKHLQERLGRQPLNELTVRVAHAAGILPYLRKAQRTGFFRDQLDSLRSMGHDWRAHASHGEALRLFREFGGLDAVPDSVRPEIVKWMVLCYVGEPGGYGDYGQQRPVFYSNSAAPLIEDLFHEANIHSVIEALEQDREVKRACRDKDVANRFQNLLDLTDK